MKKCGSFILAFIFLAISLQAQTIAGDSGKSVIVHKDARIDLLIKKNAEINQDTYMSTRHNLPGFRVQVLNTNDRGKAISVKTRLLQEFPAEKTYLIYQSPYFKIQIGNCKTRKDAESLKKLVNRIYPSEVFIVPATIDVKPDKEDDLIL